jgi:hypothetical protein
MSGSICFTHIPKVTTFKVDCSGERLTCVGKRFWNTFSSNIRIKTCKIPWGTPCRAGQLYGAGASWNFISLYHYIIRKCVSKSWIFSNVSQSFSQAIFFRIRSKVIRMTKLRVKPAPRTVKETRTRRQIQRLSKVSVSFPKYFVGSKG